MKQQRGRSRGAHVPPASKGRLRGGDERRPGLVGTSLPPLRFHPAVAPLRLASALLELLLSLLFHAPREMLRGIVKRSLLGEPTRLSSVRTVVL